MSINHADVFLLPVSVFQLLLEHTELVYLLSNAVQLTEEHSPEMCDLLPSQINCCYMKQILVTFQPIPN